MVFRAPPVRPRQLMTTSRYWRPLAVPSQPQAMREALEVWKLNLKIEDAEERAFYLGQKGRELMAQGKAFYSVAATSFRIALASFGDAYQIGSLAAADLVKIDTLLAEGQALAKAGRYADAHEAYGRLERIAQWSLSSIELGEGHRQHFFQLRKRAQHAARRKESLRREALKHATGDMDVMVMAARKLYADGELVAAEDYYRELQDLAMLAAHLTVDEHDQEHWEREAQEYRDRAGHISRTLMTERDTSRPGRPLQISRITLDHWTELLMDPERRISMLRFGHVDIPLEKFRGELSSDVDSEDQTRILSTRESAVLYGEDGELHGISQDSSRESVKYTLDSEWLSVRVPEALLTDIINVLDIHGAPSTPVIRVLADPEQLEELFDRLDQKPTQEGKEFLHPLVETVSAVLMPGQSVTIDFYSRFQGDDEKPWFGTTVSVLPHSQVVKFRFSWDSSGYI